MHSTRPRFALIAEVEAAADRRLWRFALHAADGASTIAASDSEPDADDDRLTLLAVVRGLEALDQPSEVTIVTRSTTVARGLRRDLHQWRLGDWRWERHGRWTPIRDADLWRRVDQALRFHTLRCRLWDSHTVTEVNACGPRLAPAPCVAGSPDRHERPRREPSDASLRFDAPAMVIVQGRARRRRVRFATPAAVAG